MGPADEYARHSALPLQHFGTIVIIGGGCYGSYYLRQLRRASEHAALSYDRIVVVDRDTACAVAGDIAADFELHVHEWRAWLDGFLAGEAREGDAIVPSPLMPHLLFEWLEQRARERWPERNVSVRTPSAVNGVPWQREGKGSTRYVSFAEWICPVNCVEPRSCPHTRGARTWSMPAAIEAAVLAARDSVDPLDGPAIFRCVHRAYGVGMIDVGEVLDAEKLMVAAAARGRVNLLVGTMSHCHGALGILAVE